MKFSYNISAPLYIIFCLLVNYINCNNILLLNFNPYKSHIIWYTTLAKGLVNEGHNITVLQMCPGKSENNNYTLLQIKGYESYKMPTPEVLIRYSFANYFPIKLRNCKYILKSPEFRILHQQATSGVKYDLIIIDLIDGPCLYPLIKLFGPPPVIGGCTLGMVAFITRSFGVNGNEFYVPFYAQEYSTHMNFFERIYNYLVYGYEYYLKTYFWGQYNALHKKYFALEMEDLIQFEKNFSLLLVNYDPVLDLPYSLPANVIPIGGLHITEPKPLEKDLQLYLDNSKQGVIVLSLGTILRLDRMKRININIFLNTFAKLQQNVIIKYKSDTNIPLPHNVKIMEYLPQIDILAHHNVKLIINHGGALSTHEAIFLGVPLIVIPFFMDQHSRATNIVEKKIGQKLHFLSLTEDIFLSTIQEVLKNPIYKSNSQKLSKIFRDKPLTPQQSAVFWVQHVMRNGGAHLRTPASDLPLYRQYFLDLWICMTLCIYLFMKTIQCVLRASKFQLNKHKTELF